MSSPACILSFVATALARGELRDAWTWSDDPAQKTAEQVPESVVTPEIHKESNVSHVLNGDTSCQADAQAPQGFGEEGAVEPQSEGTGDEKTKDAKKRNKGRGRKQS
jgi:minor histocompatibility antigen H13